MSCLRLVASVTALGFLLAFGAPAGAQPQSSEVARIIDISTTPETRVLEVPARPLHHPHHGLRRHFGRAGWALSRPVLAGVLLVTRVPGPFKTPEPPVIAPAYLFDSVAADLTTPPPPLVCQRRPRDPALPDPHLYREVPLACHYDID
jgi:hypothetical protein